MQIAAGVIQTVPIWEFLEVTAEPAVVEGAHKLENPLCTTLFCYWRATDRQTDRRPFQRALHRPHLFDLFLSLLLTWHKFRFFPQSLEVHADQPAERGRAGLLFTIQHEVVLHKHLLIWLTGKYYN